MKRQVVSGLGSDGGRGGGGGIMLVEKGMIQWIFSPFVKLRLD